MRSFSLVLLVVMCSICALAEPPRKRFNFRSFARQEAVEGEGNEQPQGYNYEAPTESRRLKLPAKLRVRTFARQEEQSGYSYPKPTQAYGPPEEGTTTDPSTEYGTPQTESPQTDEPSTDNNFEEGTTTNPQSETLRSLQATQFRRQNAKLARIQTAPARVGKQKQFQQVRSQVSVIEQQPIYYVQYPYQHADFIDEPELVYFLKK